MGLGIIDMVGLAASLIFAIPLGMYGLNQLLGDEPVLGGFLVAIAVLMVYLPQKLTTPQDLPGKVAERVIGSAVAEPEEPAESTEK